MFETGEKSVYRGLNPLTIPLNVTDMCIVNSPRPLSIVWSLGYSHLSHNRCLWIPVGIHTCSLSGRSHSGKMHSEDSCCFCKRSVGNSNEKCLSVFFSPYFYILFYIFFPQMRAIVSIDRRKCIVRLSFVRISSDAFLSQHLFSSAWLNANFCICRATALFVFCSRAGHFCVLGILWSNSSSCIVWGFDASNSSRNSPINNYPAFYIQISRTLHDVLIIDIRFALNHSDISFETSQYFTKN